MAATARQRHSIFIFQAGQYHAANSPESTDSVIKKGSVRRREKGWGPFCLREGGEAGKSPHLGDKPYTPEINQRNKQFFAVTKSEQTRVYSVTRRRGSPPRHFTLRNFR